jgi:protein ImuA
MTAVSIIDDLAGKIRALETANRFRGSKSVLSSGCVGLDACLPSGGYEPGTIVEWLESPGCGGCYLALAAARQATLDGKSWVVVDRQRHFYPLAAQAMGLALDRLIVIHPKNKEDEHWAVDQALRCSAVGAVVAELDEISDFQGRRFQLAAEHGGALGLFLRPPSVRGKPSWSEIQWLVESPVFEQPASDTLMAGVTRRIDIQGQRFRGGRSGQRWTVVMNFHQGIFTLEENRADSNRLCLAAELAMPASTAGLRRRTQPSGLRLTGS